MRQTAKAMFESATIRLTLWYLIILMAISIAFSVSIYHLSVGELQSSLVRYEQNIMNVYLLDLEQLYAPHLDTAQTQMIVSLVWINVFILLAGGIGSYLLARRTLKPIQQAHELQSRFVSDASHELRTPLSVMTTELEVALRAKLSKKDMQELLESNLEEVNKLTELSQTLLKLSTGDSNSLEYRKIDLNSVLSHIAERDRRIKDSSSGTVNIYAHQRSIEDLLNILTDNAIKYSPADTPIRIHASERAGRITIKVSNSGEGIAAKDLPHIFDRFYRADNSRSSSGHGLGLSLAKQIVELHNGRITASSTQNKVTTITVSLPRGSRTYRRQQAVK